VHCKTFRVEGTPYGKPLEISPLSRAQESSLCDTVTLLAEANAKLGETIVAQGDQIIQLNELLEVLRKKWAPGILTAGAVDRTL